MRTQFLTEELCFCRAAAAAAAVGGSVLQVDDR